MTEKSEIEESTRRVLEESKEESKSSYHYRMAEELSAIGIEYKANPPIDWYNSSSGGGPNKKMFNETESSGLGPVYSFFLEDELYIEIVSKDSITREDERNLENSVESSEKWFFVPDNLSKGVMINFVKGGNEPEFYWFSE